MTATKRLPRPTTRTSRSHSSVRRVLVFLVAAAMGFLIYGIAADSFSVTYYLLITVILTGVVALLHRSVGFSAAVLWGLTCVAIGNIAGGVLLINGAPLYELPVLGSIRYDKVFHAIAAGVAAWAFLEALNAWGLRRTPILGFCAAMMAIGAGALVEVVEYFGSLLIENDSVGGYTNNMQDLVVNTVGAAFGATWAYRSHQYPNGDELSRLSQRHPRRSGHTSAEPKPEIAGKRAIAPTATLEGMGP